MAEETKKPEVSAAAAAAAPPPAAEEVVVPEAEKPTEKEIPPPETVAEAEKPPAEAEAVTESSAQVAEKQKISQQVSFKEETNVVSELPQSHRKALEEFKKLIQESLEKHEFSSPPPPAAKEEEKKYAEQPPPSTDSAAVETEKLAEEAAPAASSAAVEAEKPAEEAAPPASSAAEAGKPAEEAASAAGALAEEKKEEVKPVETTVVAAIEKTVEAIKETIVEVTPTAPAQETAAEPQKEVVVEGETSAVVVEVPVEPEEVSIWGIPLLADERSDVILLKFLRARDFKVKEALAMIRNTVRWRKEFGVDSLLEEDMGSDYEKVVFTHGIDKEGRAVCYNVFGEFQNKELYQNTFSDAEKRKKFLRWLIQFLEKTIRTLDFSPRGINSFVLVNDLKNSPGYGKRDLYKVIDKFLQLLQDNYPEFVAKQLCINVSWWYLAYNWIYLTVFTPRSKSKFVFASPSKTAETLFKYIAPEQVPVQYGGHSKDGEHEFSPADPVTEVTIKPGAKHPIEFAFSEASELVWELRVIGWEVSYGAEFLPAKEGGYTLNISKPKKVTTADEPVICDTFKVTEPGKVVLTIDNQTSKKKKLLYRSKLKASQ